MPSAVGSLRGHHDHVNLLAKMPSPRLLTFRAHGCAHKQNKEARFPDGHHWSVKSKSSWVLFARSCDMAGQGKPIS